MPKTLEQAIVDLTEEVRQLREQIARQPIQIPAPYRIPGPYEVTPRPYGIYRDQPYWEIPRITYTFGVSSTKYAQYGPAESWQLNITSPGPSQT